MDIVYTGFKRLDEVLKINKGDLVVIGGRPAIGKTCFLCSMIERSKDHQTNMFFAMQTYTHKAVEKLSAVFNNRRVICNYAGDFYDFVKKIAVYNKEKPIDAIFIDNFDILISLSNTSREKIIVMLKDLAASLKVAIIVVDESDRNYRLKSKEFLKYADKILLLNAFNNDCTDLENVDVSIFVEKDLDACSYNEVIVKFNKKTLTFR